VQPRKIEASIAVYCAKLTGSEELLKAARGATAGREQDGDVMDDGMTSAAPGELRRPPSDGAIFDRIVAAVLEQKLAGGAKLPEAALCEAFDCSRSQIRRVLVVLAERGVVALHPNRGAFVAKPSADEARDVFEARRAIERSIVLAAAGRIEADALSELRANARAGGGAETAGDRSESIRLSGEFHLRLAEAAGNAVLTRFLEDLVTRTSLIIGLYGSRAVRSCSESEHDALIDALARRDGPAAAALMEHHLKHVESALDIRDAEQPPADVRRLFGPG
jgi:DNA-binding GntR family transcriptional regulator